MLQGFTACRRPATSATAESGYRNAYTRSGARAELLVEFPDLHSLAIVKALRQPNLHTSQTT